MKRADASKPVRVLLVEDQPLVREAIASEFRRDPDFDLVGEAGSLAEARGMVDRADVAILDLGLPDGFGGDLIPQIRAANPNAQVLVLTSSYDRAQVTQAVESGVVVLDKTTHLGRVAQAVSLRANASRRRPRTSADAPLGIVAARRGCALPMPPCLPDSPRQAFPRAARPAGNVGDPFAPPRGAACGRDPERRPRHSGGRSPAGVEVVY